MTCVVFWQVASSTWVEPKNLPTCPSLSLKSETPSRIAPRDPLIQVDSIQLASSSDSCHPPCSSCQLKLERQKMMNHPQQCISYTKNKGLHRESRFMQSVHPRYLCRSSITSILEHFQLTALLASTFPATECICDNAPCIRISLNWIMLLIYVSLVSHLLSTKHRSKNHTLANPQVLSI